VPQILLPILPKITITAVIDVLAVAILIYQIALVLQGRRAAHILTGIGTLLVIYVIAVWAKLELLREVLAAIAPYSVIAVIVMFQSEIRWLLARMGRARWLGLGSRLERREVAEEVVLAVQQMAEAKVGALIVVERDIGLRTFIESGVPLDALVSRDVLCSIFEPGGALHDGAVIIQGDRIAAAACFLPLTTNPVMLRRMATRHRAAIGVTEETDALSIVVSEESGQIAIAMRGDIEPDVSLERVHETLTHYASGRGGRHEPAVETNWKQAEP
jgi:diadenylate cyclase